MVENGTNRQTITQDKETVGKTRPDTRLPQSRVGGQGPFLRSLHDTNEHG